ACALSCMALWFRVMTLPNTIKQALARRNGQPRRSLYRYRTLMPELPEVETVRRGLEPLLAGAVIQTVTLHRANLRFAFPQGFAAALEGKRIETLSRRAKYLLFTLSDGAVWLTHLGMTGAYLVGDRLIEEPSRLNAGDDSGKHVHFSAELTHPGHGRILL